MSAFSEGSIGEQNRRTTALGMQPTINGLNPFVCVSALQKCIWRGMEREAMEFAVELARTSKAYFSWACNRIEICSHEDIGLAWWSLPASQSLSSPVGRLSL